jgi:hypothetical protein
MLLTWCRQLANRKSQAVAGRHRAGARRKRGQRPRLERLEDRLAPSTHTWTGAQSIYWDDDDNWNGNSPYGDPAADVVFPRDGVTNKTSINNRYGDRLPIHSIVFEGDGFLVKTGHGGMEIELTGVIYVTAAGTNTLDSVDSEIATVMFRGLNRIVVENPTASLVMNGNLSALSSLVKDGAGTLVLGGHTEYDKFTSGFSDFRIYNGRLVLGAVDVLHGAPQMQVLRPGTLDLNNFDATVSDLIGQGTISLGTGNLTVVAEGFDSNFDGTISGPGGLTVAEDVGHRFLLQGNGYSYTGPTNVTGGTLEVYGALSPASTVTVGPGATLRGEGTVGPLNVKGMVWPKWAQNPDENVGILASGPATFLSGSSLRIRINGLLPGTDPLMGRLVGYDQLNVNGTVDLSGSPTLKASVGFASHSGDTFTILTSTDGITGTFAGLPDGTNFGVDGTPMQIHYTGTSVVLTHRPQFLPPVTYAAGLGPIFVATGDFRGHGIKDLVTANFLNASVNVLLDNGDGTFQYAVRYTASPVPTSVTVGDFNGDHHLDLVTVGNTSDGPTLSVLLGNGDGTFQAAVTSPLNRQAWAVAVGDFRGNGILDLVTANYYENTISVLLGNGDGTFRRALTYPVGRGPSSVVVRDLGNGTLDIVTANFSTVSVLLGNGDGMFRAAMDFEGSFTSIAVGDFRGNGMLDLIATKNDFVGSSVYVVLGNGNGTFAAPKDIVFVGDEPGNVAVGDFDGDGQLDFVVTTGYPSERGVALLYGQGDGTFRAPSYYYLTPSLFSLAVDSFRGNRFPDVAVINDAVVSVLLNVGDGAVPPPGGSAEHQGPTPVAALFPGDDFPQIAGVDAAPKAWPSSSRTPASATPSPWAVTPSLEVAGVERFFAAATEQNHGFGWPRSKREGLLSADDGWLDEVGKGSALVDRLFSATHSE